ncbi:heme ABC exporter ATP-binding protein CcmA [Sphingopyxis alaskensis]|uniref:Cytochrome c biogenesis ATP-binding export protein CcmA n=1 Tax=Sphingopyxis alaskensis (strain DSM 13593 / LMG 18877 / RB2256) TaxID=317655 RepID=CCMA_SPHAL|nr:heme ABC exporter ATP-binding protein CcmA [Sphingopyxis alaskensis]Q1GS38.1 RecName: Full=Cytochrome c biogenesis ATP-binding export protein CcmA; AltName: Full=Heme exporter protein A [Sphingopyxis alaskensis RB2256]ABF53534.1 heme exporter protein CcmA [Sphingopyxis alaskensis RB2256]MCM3419194.1 heme ABC exporter ATP-binding protein CcmA [Sphingopyxis alaskensis]
MTVLLALDGVACIRGDRLVFEELSLALNRGDALWVRGPNGAGKSSLIRLAAGLLRPAAGRVVRRGRIALIDEAAALDSELPLRRALDFWARVDTVDGHAVDRAMDMMALNTLADVPVAMLSTGQRRRAAMVRVIASGAPIWLLDEPANGMDQAATARLVAAIATHRANGGAVLLASHFALAIPDLDELVMGVLA